MKKQSKQPQKVYKGLFISNERRKQAGGRIRCEELPNKIEVFGKNPSLHETQVEWVEKRRYRRGQKMPKRPLNKKESQKKGDKYKQKEESIQQKGGVNQQSLKKKPKYKLAEKVEKQSVKEQTATEESKMEQKKESEPIQEQRRGQEQQQQSENEEETKEEEDKEEPKEEQLQIIVGEIIKETKITYKTKQFVGILTFTRKNKKKDKGKYADKNVAPLEQIFKDFYTDIHPIHSRLPNFEVDDLLQQNFDILNKYATKILGYDKDEKRKKEMNRILDALSDIYVVSTFSEWDGTTPLAKIIKIVGKTRTIEGECECFLHQHMLNDFHYQEQKKGTQIQINPTPYHHKTQRLVFTIDPPTSTDLDDALSIEPLPNDEYQIGIHIADVSSYLKFMDRTELVKRTTSVYLPHKVFHMLKKEVLSVCSLDPGKQRLAFSVYVKMNLAGEVLGDSRLEKSIVKSRYKLYYAIVQEVITNKMDHQNFNLQYPCTPKEFDQLKERLLQLANIAQKHRNLRMNFDVFENQEMEFELDEERWPIKLNVDRRYTSKKMIEQYMIIGNIEAAKHLVRKDPTTALIIHHPKPSKLGVKFFNQMFAKKLQLEKQFTFDNCDEVQSKLLQISHNQKIPSQIKQICYFRARRIQQAAKYKVYSQIEVQGQKEQTKKDLSKANNQPQKKIIHFALNLQFYTHFTSPMRRMADILVHESLNRVVFDEQEEEGKHSISEEEILKINEGRRYTKRLKKDLTQVYLCLMLYRKNEQIEEEGIIYSFGLSSVSIYLPKFDMMKEVMWKSQFDVYKVSKVRGKEEELDVKLYHDPKTAKKDVFWVMKKFQRVKLIIGCTKHLPLRLKIQMEVQSEKGLTTIHYHDEQL